MSIRLDKPWIPLSPHAVDVVPGQLGVYELADSDHRVIFIGMAGARSLFGLRGELKDQLEKHQPEKHQCTWFRYEVNMAYLTRYQELLMVYQSDFSGLPELNRDNSNSLGRLQPL